MLENQTNCQCGCCSGTTQTLAPSNVCVTITVTCIPETEAEEVAIADESSSAPSDKPP